MAKDDYFVLVYKILKALYECLKKGCDVDLDRLKPGTKDFPITEKYWEYIWEKMISEGLVEGAGTNPILGGDLGLYFTDRLAITPKGIEYLQENKMMKKVAGAFGKTVEITLAVIPTVL